MTRIELMRALPPGAARNAVDCALWDLEAKLSGRSVAELLHQPEPQPVTIALTVSLDSPEAMARAAAAMNGAPVIKVKVDATEPEACLRAVRAAAPDAVPANMTIEIASDRGFGEGRKDDVRASKITLVHVVEPRECFQLKVMHETIAGVDREVSFYIYPAEAFAIEAGLSAAMGALCYGV